MPFARAVLALENIIIFSSVEKFNAWIVSLFGPSIFLPENDLEAAS